MSDADSLPRLALVMVAVGDLAGSGGAERHFSDLFEYLRAIHPGRVSLVTSRAALGRLQSAGHLQRTDDVIALPLGPRPARSKFDVLRMTAALLWTTLARRFEVVHIVLPTPSYVPFLSTLRLVPRSLRPRLAISVIDCTLAHNLEAPLIEDLYERQVVDAHRMYFNWTRLDGVFTWYRAFADTAARLRLLPDQAIVAAARFCFTDPQRYRPSETKQPIVVWAGRLSAQKRPLLFVDAVAALRKIAPALMAGWRFEMYGRGALEGDVRRAIADHGLSDVISLSHTPDLSPVFARTRLFVSTQAFENFTSLAMLEAMAAGNAVIAANVGQTAEFVQHGANGLLADAESPEGFARAIADYLQRSTDHAAMAAASARLAKEVHTVDHFAGDIVDFWEAGRGFMTLDAYQALVPILACPDCRAPLAVDGDSITCQGCARGYGLSDNGVLMLMPLTPRPDPPIYDDPDFKKFRAMYDADTEGVYYSKQNSVFSWIHHSAHQRLHEYWSNGRGGGWVADIGCGTGDHFSYFGDLRRVIGVDTSLGSLSVVRKHFPDALLIQADINALPFVDGALEAAFAIYNLEHLYYLEDGLNEIDRVLAANGRFFVGLPTEGGVAWSLGRWLAMDRKYLEKLGIDYGRVMRIEHCNTANAVMTACRQLFRQRRRHFFPMPMLPSVHPNLTIAAEFEKR